MNEVTVEFKQLFRNAVNQSILIAERTLNRSLSNNLVYCLYGNGYHGESIDEDTVLSGIYINNDEYYKIIDVSVIEVSNVFTKVFIRISGHPPVNFEQTWNPVNGDGPFKQLIANIKQLD